MQNLGASVFLNAELCITITNNKFAYIMKITYAKLCARLDQNCIDTENKTKRKEAHISCHNGNKLQKFQQI